MEKQEFKDGIYEISNEEYHAAKGLSRSALWTFKQLPQKYWYEYLSGQFERPADKESYIIGSMLHTMLLEPQLFDDVYHVMPKVNRATKQGKIDYQEALEASQGRTLINQEQLIQVLAMADSLKEQDVVRDILAKGAIFERSFFWTDPDTGVQCKSRPDIWNSPLCADLKTTEDAGYRSFQSSAYKYGYFLQVAMIYEALKAHGFECEKQLFICVEKKPPYSVGLYLLDDEALQFGREQFRSLIRNFAECLEKEVWPDYGIQMLMIPKYATMETTE